MSLALASKMPGGEYYGRCLAIRMAIDEKPEMKERLCDMVRRHHLQTADRLDAKGDRLGSQRAVYAAGQILISGSEIHIAIKLPLPSSDLAYLYAYGECLAHEFGVFDSMASRGKQVPKFYMGFTYTYDGEQMFGILVEDLTCGGKYRVEAVHYGDVDMRNHLSLQVPLQGEPREVFTDLKTFQMTNPTYAQEGLKYLRPEALVALGVI